MFLQVVERKECLWTRPFPVHPSSSTTNLECCQGESRPKAHFLERKTLLTGKGGTAFEAPSLSNMRLRRHAKARLVYVRVCYLYECSANVTSSLSEAHTLWYLLCHCLRSRLDTYSIDWCIDALKQISLKKLTVINDDDVFLMHHNSICVALG